MIPCFRYRAPGDSADRVLLIMLPGVGIEAEEFESRGLIAALHSHAPNIDVVAAGPSLDLYYDGTIVAGIEESIIRPAIAAGYTRLWLLGISLGGMGALLYGSGEGAPIEHVILLAPFLGTPGTIASVIRSGGLAAWSADTSFTSGIERKALLWLKEFVASPPRRPILHLCYGHEDRFAPGYEMLADALGKDRVVTVEGGHDWATWTRLWDRLLSSMPLWYAESAQS